MAATEATRASLVEGVEISVFVHATEDEGKVERAALNLIPEGIGTPTSKVRRLTGHHNDPIVLMTMRIKKKTAAGEIFRNLLRSLSKLDRLRLIDEAEERVDEAGNLYLRLDKQSVYRGKAVLQESDAIRVKFKFRVPHGANPVSTVRASIAEVEQKSGF